MMLKPFHFFVFILFINSLTFAQSKREQIKLLTHKTDSLTGVVAVKDKEISMLKKELDQCLLLHSEDMNALNQKISLLEAELHIEKKAKSSKNAKNQKANKELKSELATTKKVLDSIMNSETFFKTGKSTILKKEGKPKIEVVDIQGGTFVMGSPESEKARGTDENQHKVTLSDFKMSKYEITFEMYDAYCDSVGLEKPDDNGWGRGNRPVINISWREAYNFAQWMGGRLPTEAEWEYAARANGKFAFGKSNCLSTKQANFDASLEFMRCGEEVKKMMTMPVGSFEANAFGLHDMYGNVYEWCGDWYGVYSLGTSVDPEGPVTGGNRVNRGGCWANSASACRAASRESSSVDFKGNRIGFRIVFPK
jgi:formylglycine-generating enzyme required for sulfatase activity